MIPAPMEYPDDVICLGLTQLEELSAACDGSHFAIPEQAVNEPPEALWCLLIDLKHALARLPIQQRKAVYFRMVLRLSEEEAARRSGVQRRTFRDRLRAGMKNLKKLLNDPRQSGPPVSLYRMRGSK